MWKILNDYPLFPEKSIQADQIFLGWKKVLKYSNNFLTDVDTGNEICRGNVKDCSLSRDYCAVIVDERCRILGLYNDFDQHFDEASELEQVSMMASNKVAIRTRDEVLIYNFSENQVVFRKEMKAIQIASGFDHLLALDAEGNIFIYGDGSRGQLGAGTLTSCETMNPVEDLEEVKIVQIAAGGWHSAALSDRGYLYQWGWNQNGQCGKTRNGKSPNVIASPKFEYIGNPIREVQCGTKHTSVLDKESNLISWGCNDFGQCVNYTHHEPPIQRLRAAFWSTAVEIVQQ